MGEEMKRLMTISGIESIWAMAVEYYCATDGELRVADATLWPGSG